MRVQLIMTSILFFLPRGYQLPFGMVVSALYFIIILLAEVSGMLISFNTNACLQPHLYPSNRRLHLVAQLDLTLFMFGALVYYTLGVIDPVTDILMSVILIAVCCSFILLFLMHGAAKIVRLANDPEIRDSLRAMLGRRRKATTRIDEVIKTQEKEVESALPRANIVVNPLIDLDSPSRIASSSRAGEEQTSVEMASVAPRQSKRLTKLKALMSSKSDLRSSVSQTGDELEEADNESDPTI